MKNKKHELRKSAPSAVVTAARPDSRWPVYSALAAALIAVWWAYSPALHGPFLFDDNVLPFALPGANATFTVWTAGVRPVTMLTYWINARLSGEDPFSYHVLSVVLHCITSGLVFLIVRRLLSWSTALHAAVEDLAGRMGREPDRWRWDAVHRAVFPHQAFESVGILRPFFSRRVPNGGDWSTVNVGPVTVTAPYEQRSVPGYRGIVDLSPANDSRFIESVGPSGNVLSKYYDSFQRDWRDVRYRKMRMDRLDIETGAIGRLRLYAAH